MFDLTQIPQVVMNIDNKQEPIADKNVAAYFHPWYFNSYAKLLYHFKKNEYQFIPDLRLFFIKTVIRKIKYICKDLFLHAAVVFR